MKALYQLLRHLTPPVSAVTTAADGHRNGLIVNSAQRASLVLSRPRISLYISKTNHSHDMIYRSGVLGVHLLRSDQWELIAALGLRSAREGDKLTGLEMTTGKTGCPLLTDVLAGFECRVINAMDAGAATFFLADVVADHIGRPGPVMTSEYFREHLPAAMRESYEARLAHAQAELERLAPDIDPAPWPGPVATP